jgi:hypothetical protein
MNVTLSLDDKLVEELNRIAADRATTLDVVVGEYLQPLAETEFLARRERHIEGLRKSFEMIKGSVGPITWTRDDLYERD